MPSTTAVERYVPSRAARKVDQLSFISRPGPYGRICWWDVTPPNTDYWHVHEMLGKAYAYELIDFLRAGRKNDEFRIAAFKYIACEIADRKSGVNDSAVYNGFFGVISEYLATGRFDR